ncbi:S8 family serine peptidase [Billgrantia sp. LNSP4103-1]|uniref:S8 family serine peptidase n=1 Tax=Billgrantia sp. LNSP4103-1 TaxID=3410266 RepID=UPI00403F98E0
MTQGCDPHARLAGLLLALSLAGCSSGGGSVPRIDSPEPPPSPPPHDLDPSPISQDPDIEPPDGGYSVLVGVADSGFRLTHESLSPRLASVGNVAEPDDPDVSSASRHGTAVASVVSLARDTRDLAPGDHGLNLAKVNRGDALHSYSNVMDYSVGYLADLGSRVVNHSYSGRLEAPSSTSSYLDRNSLDSLHRVVTANDGLGSVYVVAAGNQGEALQAERPIHQQAEIFERMLIVGGSTRNDTNEIEKAMYSNFPGDDERWQSRFLTAPWRTLVALDDADDSYGWGLGTSFATPRVTAYAAAIIELWPHLDATQVSQLLLDTADRTSPLYGQNDCGDSGDQNCGFFYLGQGEADLEEALEPQGELVMPTGASVDEGGQSLERSAAQLSDAYGDALAESGVLQEVAVFDALGRDYRTDLSGHVTQRSGRDRSQHRQMEQMAMATQGHRTETRGEFDSMRFMARHNVFGEATSARLDGRFGRHEWSLFQFSGDEPNPMSPQVEAGFMPMLSFQGGTAVSRGLERIAGASHRLELNERIALEAEHWSGSADEEMTTLADRYRAERSSIALAMDLGERLTLTGGVGVRREAHGLLGAQGTGALSLGEDNRLNLQRLQLDYRLGETLTAFASHEEGRGEMTGNGLIQSIEGIRTRETALGLQWRGDGHQAALALRQPMRIADAEAQLSIPTGRTLDGTVVRDDVRVSLAPSGQQRDIEFGYALLPSERTRLQLNLLYSIEPGHDRNANDEIAAMVNYTHQF